MSVASTVRSAIKTAFREFVDITVPCIWIKVSASVYDTATGSETQAISHVSFRAIRDDYKVFERVAGVQAGDTRLYVDSTTTHGRPDVGDTILVRDVRHEVVSVSEDPTGSLYTIQARKK